MSIKVEEAKKYEGYEQDEFKIAQFLENHKGYAYTFGEIRKEIGLKTAYNPDEHGSYWTGQNVGMFALDVADAVLLSMTLERMVRDGKINAREIAGKRYYFIE
jgi:hypothetical protein